MTSKLASKPSATRHGARKIKVTDVKDLVVKPLKPKKEGQRLNSPRFRALMKKTNSITGDEAESRQRKKRCYSTGNIALDLAIGLVDPYGNIGIPERSFVEIFGPNGVMKSGTLHKIIRSVQRAGKIAVVLFSEEPDMKRMRRDGVNTKDLVIINAYEPQGREAWELTGERTLSDAVRWSKEPEVGLVAVDSIKGLSTNIQLYKKGDGKNKEDRDMAQVEYGARANLMERFFNRIKPHCKNAIVVLLNQLSESADEFQIGADIRPKTPAGRRKEFECTLRIHLASRSLKYKEEHDVHEKSKPEYGRHVLYWVVKNRRSEGMSGKRCDIEYIFDKNGFDNAKAAFNMAVYADIIEKSGSNYTVEGRKINGRQNVIDAIEADRELFNALKVKLIEKRDMLFRLKSGANKKTVKSVFAKALEDEKEDEEIRAIERQERKDKTKLKKKAS